MAKRIQVVVEKEEAERFRRQAAAEGLSLSAWFRGLAHARLAEASKLRDLGSVQALREFWTVCDSGEKGREPDWEEHLDIIHRSRGEGGSPT